MTTIRGQVSASAGRTLGDGFSPSKANAGDPNGNRTGDYAVAFEKPFANDPVIVVTAFPGDASTTRTATIYESNSSVFFLTIRNSSGDRRDSAFNFFASDEFNA